ncbi:MAG: VOC family protein, partial [Flavobacteriales bacterium]|nr:VOC family protein [Flavobacteriales bacterium]
MSANFKPAGYTTVSPYFIVPEADRFIQLMKELFDAKELRRYDNSDGSLMHAELMLDDSVIMLGQATEKYPAVPMVMHVYVPVVDAAYKKAIELGCTSMEPPKQREGDPDRRASFKDYAG